jgi:hypothetical protein
MQCRPLQQTLEGLLEKDRSFLNYKTQCSRWESQQK